MLKDHCHFKGIGPLPKDGQCSTYSIRHMLNYLFEKVIKEYMEEEQP